MKTYQEYKNSALAALKGNWAPAVLASVIVAALMTVVVVLDIITNPFMSGMVQVGEKAESIIIISALLFTLFVVGPAFVGYYNSFLKFMRDGDNRFCGNAASMAVQGWGRSVLFILINAVLESIGFILLFVPGVIVFLMYSQTWFILKDNPELSVIKCMRLSRQMMKGHKFDYFCFTLSFLGWVILATITLCIGLFWLLPYMTSSLAAYYEELKCDYENGVVPPQTEEEF